MDVLLDLLSGFVRTLNLNWAGSWGTFELIVRVVAIGAIPTNRRPSSSTAWLLLIFLVPVVDAADLARQD